MGLYINHLHTIRFASERSLYIYLLDYGWPEGNWEKIFKKHFMKLADLASETGAAIIGSPSGVHFGNEVLSWYKVGHLNADEVLPALLITKTDPHYFSDGGGFETSTDEKLKELLVIPLKVFCTNEDQFVVAIEKVFSDLKAGTELENFEIAEYDLTTQSKKGSFQKAGGAIELKPNFFGLGVDLRKLFS